MSNGDHGVFGVPQLRLYMGILESRGAVDNLGRGQVMGKEKWCISKK